MRHVAGRVGAVALGLGLLVIAPEVRADGPDGDADAPVRPWSAGTLAPGAALGFGYDRDALSFGFGVGLDYYVLPGFSLGFSLGDQILIYSNDLRARLPSVEDQIPTNMFRATGIARFVFFRSRAFSPFVFAGLGPTLLNNDNGTFAHWVAGPGAYLHLAGAAYLNLGMTFEGMFPVESCDDAFVYEPTQGVPFRAVTDYCSFRWGPRLGIVVEFGGDRRRQRRGAAVGRKRAG